MCVLVAGCTRNMPDELAELVIRTQFTDVPPDSVACISVEGHDAGKHLLSALGDLGVKVVPESACVYVSHPGEGSYERATGRKAVLIYITADLDRDEVEYLSRYHAKWALRVLVRVRHENGHWRILEVLEREAA